mgnify:CR=1 FL=1
MTSDGGRKYEKGVFSFASSGCLYERALFPSLATAKHQRWRGGIWGTHVPHQACANGSQGPLSCDEAIPPLSDSIRFSGGIKYVKERSVWAACGVYGGRELTACFQTSRRTAYLAQESTTEDATKFAEKTVWTVQRTPSGLGGRPPKEFSLWFWFMV